MIWKISNKTLTVDGSTYKLKRTFTKEEVAQIIQSRGELELENGTFVVF